MPVLVGLEYFFAPNKVGSIVTHKTPQAFKWLFEESIGTISIFNTIQLPRYKPRLDEAMSEYREWAAEQR